MVHRSFTPASGSAEEKELYKKIQSAFSSSFEEVFSDNLAKKAVVIVPSLTLDPSILAKIKGAVHYEERMLCLLMLLRMPRMHIVYVSSQPIDPCIIDYYLHLLPGITGFHANQRLTLLSCYDASKKSLTEKILERPRLMERIRQAIPHDYKPHIACFNVTPAERTLAVQLNMPVYGSDPDHWYLGSKSGSRKIFKHCGIRMPAGFEDLGSEDDIAEALTELKSKNPALRKAVVKLNEGFSGDGNGIFSFEHMPEHVNMKEWVRKHLHHMSIVASDVPYYSFIDKFNHMQGIVEEFVEGDIKTSPSAQCRINPKGEVSVVSTHDQLLGGESGQVFLGAHFPANPEYAIEIGNYGKMIGEELQKQGAMGRFSADFISVKEGDEWVHYAIEINLRKGGTTHPFLMLQFLTDGKYNPDTGLYQMPNGQYRYYFASDNLQSVSYKGITPPDLIDIAMLHGLHFNSHLEKGVMFHLIGTLSQYGKLGLVCIGESPEDAWNYYLQTVKVLDEEGRKRN
jgi:PGM1 C-terminal domain